MPVYEYECEKCRHVTESLRKMSDADGPQVCAACGGERTHRLQSVFAAGGAKESPLPAAPCGRCGDPRGACGM